MANASKAASQDRILNENATIDRHINATLINGSWVDPIIKDGKIYPVLEAEDPTVPVIVPLTPNATIVEPMGCDMKMPSGHKLDKLVGEWCSLDVSRGGFYFRGLRTPEGKLLLQRFTLSRHVSKFPAEANMTAAANNGSAVDTTKVQENNANAQVAVLLESETEAETEVDAEADAEAEVDAEEEGEVDADEEADVDAEAEEEGEADAEEEGEADAEDASFVEVDAEAEVDLEAEAETEVDAEEEGEYELDATFEVPAGSEDSIFMELGVLLSANDSPRNAKAGAGAKKGRSGYGDFLMTSLPNGVVLPPVRKPAASLCSARAKEFLSCSGGTLNEFDELVGDEMNGFCLNDQTSAAVATMLTPYAPRLGPHADFFTRVSAAPDVIAPTHLVETTFNAEQDHARMCFLPGGVADGKRFEAAGNYAAETLGESTGLYKPLMNSRCMSAFCENSGIVGSKKPKAIVLNFRP